MGYDLYIIRRKDWNNFEEESNISLEEWLAYVQNDEELVLTDGYQIKKPGIEDSFHNVPGFCSWIKHPAKQNHEHPWFDYGSGCISTKNPDEDTICKMIKIAGKLNAKVQGDDGEFYDESYFLKKQKSIASQKRWWKFW